MRLLHSRRAFAFLLVAALFVGLACIPGHDELTSSRDAVAALPVGRAMLERATVRPFVAAGDGFELAATSTALAETLVTELPRAAHHPIRLTVGDRAVAVYREHARPGHARLDRGVVIYDDAAAGVASLWLSAGRATEELLVVDETHAPLRYRLALPSGWSLVAGEQATARVVDERGRPMLHVSATRAWDAEGDPVEVSMDVHDMAISLELGPVATWPVVVDPTWLSASAPVQLRQNHTASLMGDGSVWLVGGSNGGPLTSVERFDPATGENQLVTALADPRTGHTATVLQDGRLLIAGGNDGTADLDSTALLDPITGASLAGPTMSGPRLEHAAIRLLDGRVLLAGGGTNDVQLFDPSTDTFSVPIAVAFSSGFLTGCRLVSGLILLVAYDGAFLFDPSNDTVTPTDNPFESGVFEPIAPVLVPLRDGRALLTGGFPCGSVGGPSSCSKTAKVFDPAGAGTFTTVGSTARDRIGAAAARLPDGRVLVAGGDDVSTSPDIDSFELFDPTVDGFAAAIETMNVPHLNATATILPSGTALVVGGSQAGADLYQPSRGTFTAGPDFDPATGRTSHSATRLTDGRVLYAGGSGLGDTVTQILDPSTNTFSPSGSLVTGRQAHRAQLLDDGTVLLVGGVDGGTTSAEVFDPVAGASNATGDLTEARETPTLTRLPDGRVLVAGGGPASIEIYTPGAGTFSTLGDGLGVGTERAASALLADGRVLIVGAQAAHAFDPIAETLTALPSPGAVYVEPTLQLLANGTVLLTGGSTLAAELFDPATDTFSFTGSQLGDRVAHAVTALPNGDVMLSGGKEIAVEPQVYDEVSFYTPAATGGAFHDAATGNTQRDHTATLLLDGRVVLAGGLPCDEPFFCFPNQVRMFEPGGFGLGPSLSAVPANIAPGQATTIAGTGFDPVEHGGNGASTSSSPIVVWQPRGWDVMVFGRVTSFSEGALTVVLPPSVYDGPGWLWVVVDGIPSTAMATTLDEADLGVDCSVDADCPTGFCVDAVCCDAVCDGPCEGCTAALKGRGNDGECGTVPPDRFTDDGCSLSGGAPCDTAAACDTGFCVDGVCCLSECTEQCEACDVEGSIGTCVPVTGAPHGERPACDATAPEDPCDATVCDGVTRQSCEGTVGPCDPYVCTVGGCLDSCEGDDACAVGFHCEDGTCVAGSCEGSVATLPDGTLLECAPYTCRIDGTCKTTCADVNDCVEPFACNFEGRCVARPPNDQLDAGCACETVGGGDDTTALWTLLLGLALVGARRRRGLGIAMVVVVAMSWPAVGLAQSDSGSESGSESGSDSDSGSDSGSDSDSGSGSGSDELEDVAARKAEARTRFQKGIALIREEAWAEALAEFLASRELFPTRVATTNAAIAYTKLRRFAEALQTYESLMREYPDMPKAEMTEVQKSVSELRGRVGSIEIDQTEPGATIVIDDVTRGTYPPPGPLRVSAGSHIVRVVKEGFEPFEAPVDVAGGGTERVEAPLTALTESGKLKISEAKGRALAVLVDDVEVGETPWEGRLSVGTHSVRLRGDAQLGTAPVQAPVRAQETTTLTLEGVTLDASLRVEPVPANATVYIDAVAVGRGVWEGALPSGPHKVEIREDGFMPVTRSVTLGKGEEEVLTVELERIEEDIAIPGDFVVDLAAVGLLAPSFGGDILAQCGEGCQGGVGLGAMARLHFGYEFPFGLGLGVMGGYLTATQQVEGRQAVVQPVGLEARTGEASDSLRVQGPFVGAYGSFLFDGDFPILLRLGTGPVFAKVRDQRTGSFALADGGNYQAGPIVQEPSSIHLAIVPEIRAGIRIDETFTVFAGLEVPMLVSLQQTVWDPEREVDASIDGIGAYGTEALTGRFIAMAALNLGARAQF